MCLWLLEGDKGNSAVNKKIEDAWLKIEVDEDSLFNLIEFIGSGDPHEYHLRLAWLLKRPEYFSFIVKQIYFSIKMILFH